MATLIIEDATELTRQAWAELERVPSEDGQTPVSVICLTEFQKLVELTPLAMDQKLLIVDQAEKLLHHFYAHAPFKDLQAALGALELLRSKLSTEQVTELTFHNMMSYSFLKLDDAHTLYGRPLPFRNAFAFLPFQLKEFVRENGKENSEPHYVVSKLMPGFLHEFFQPGVEIISWCDSEGRGFVPMAQAVSESARIDLGPNPAAARAYGLRRMHLRMLTFKLDPLMPFVRLVYKDPGDPIHRSIQIPWGVVMGCSPAVVFDKRALSCSDIAASEGFATMRLYKRPLANPYPTGDTGSQIKLESSLKDIFEIQHSRGPKLPGLPDPANLVLHGAEDKRFGYIRIRNFDLSHNGPVGREDLIAAEFQRLLDLQMEHSPDGLILDIRGNPGGNVRAAEYLLQMLTPKQIEAAKFHWIRNETIRKSLQTLDEANQKLLKGALDQQEQGLFDFLVQQFEAWLDDLKTWDDDEAAEDPSKLSSGKHWSSSDAANRIGQIYQGPVVLLVDGFTYSAADIFAGGFQDHAIGPVLGLDQSTGGGGGMLKQHKDLLSLSPVLDLGLEELPPGVTMSVAVLRSTRLDGSPIEGKGIVSDETIRRQRADVLEGNPLLLAKALQLLSQRRAYRLKVEGDPSWAPSGLEFKLSHSGFSNLEVYLGQERIETALDDAGILKTAIVDMAVSRSFIFRGLDDEGNVVVSTRKTVEAQ